jgi:predicted transcriptional regulator
MTKVVTKEPVTQNQGVWQIMKDRKYHTLGEIARVLGIPEQSASARVRDLRKAAFGGYTVRRTMNKKGFNQYRIV